MEVSTLRGEMNDMKKMFLEMKNDTGHRVSQPIGTAIGAGEIDQQILSRLHEHVLEHHAHARQGQVTPEQFEEMRILWETSFQRMTERVGRVETHLNGNPPLLPTWEAVDSSSERYTPEEHMGVGGPLMTMPRSVFDSGIFGSQ